MPKQKNAVKKSDAKKTNEKKVRAAKGNGLIGKATKVLKEASLGTEYKTAPSEEKSRFPFTLVIGAAVMTVLFMFIIFSFMQISQIRSDIAQMQSTIRSLEKKERTLTMELEGEYSSKIDSVAAEMGLSGESRVTRYLDDDNSPEVAEAVDPEDEGESTNTLMSAVSRSFRKFIEFME